MNFINAQLKHQSRLTTIPGQQTNKVKLKIVCRFTFPQNVPPILNQCANKHGMRGGALLLQGPAIKPLINPWRYSTRAWNFYSNSAISESISYRECEARLQGSLALIALTSD